MLNKLYAYLELNEIVEAMEMQSETSSHYLNKKTGEIIPISEDEMDTAENDESLEESPDWH